MNSAWCSVPAWTGGGLEKNGCMYMCGWVPSLFTWNQLLIMTWVAPLSDISMSLDLSWWLFFFPFKKQKWWKNERKEHFPSARVGLNRKLFSSCAAGQTLPTVSPFWLAHNTAFLAFRLPSCLTIPQISPRGGWGVLRGEVLFSVSLFSRFCRRLWSFLSISK